MSIRRIRHEEARAAAQRSASADRRAALLAETVKAFGSQAAVAAELGTSQAAISKALAEAGRATPPMADYLEINLPHAGDTVPLPDEWDALPAEQQSKAAERAAAAWRAIAILTTALGKQCQQAAEALAEDADGDDAAGLPDWIDTSGLDEATLDALTFTLGDVAAALTAHARTAWSRADGWNVAAGGYMGELGEY